MKKRILAVFCAAGLASTLSACGQEDLLKQQVSDLETRSAELAAEVTQLKTERDELHAKVQELEAQLAAMPIATDTPVVPADPAAPPAVPAAR